MDKDKNLTQNTPIAAPEAPEGQIQAQELKEGGVNAEAVQEPTDVSTEVVFEDQKPVEVEKPVEAEQPAMTAEKPAVLVEKLGKKSHKGLLIGGIVTVVLVAGAVTAWMLLSNTSEEKVEEKVEEIVEEKTETDCGATDGPTTDCGVSALEPVDINDPIVQKMWGYFNSDFFESTNVVGAMSPHAPLRSFYSEKGALSPDGLGDVYKVAVALQKLGFPYDNAEACRGDYPLYTWTDLSNVSHSSVGMKACISGDAVRGLVKTIFDDTVDLGQFDDGFLEAATYDERTGKGVGIIVNGDGWEYSSENDEMVNVASGATGAPTYRALLQAVKNNEKLFIYEAVGRLPMCYYVQGVECGNAYTFDGEEIANSAGVTFENMTEHADLFDQFKWTFKKADDGRYVFETVEKVS